HVRPVCRARRRRGCRRRDRGGGGHRGAASGRRRAERLARVRRTAPRRLGLALAGVSERLAPATTLAQVQARWPETVGAAIAAEAEPVSERDGLVTVACRSAVWAQELDLLGPEVVMRLNESLSGGGRGGPVRGLRAVVADPRRGPRRRR